MGLEPRRAGAETARVASLITPRLALPVAVAVAVACVAALAHPVAASAAAPRTFVSAGPSGAAPQAVVREVWSGVGGGTLGDIPVGAEPTSRELLTRLEGPWNVGDNYGDRVRAYLVAPETGEYTFWLSGDDDTELSLSPDADPGARTPIASVTGWTDRYQWDRFPSQRSVPVSLVAGERYALQVLHKESGGGDHWAVGWSRPGQSSVTPAEVVPGSVLTPNEPATQETAPAFALGADQAGVTFECRLDGGVWEACGPSVSLTALSEGSHALEARATNAALEADATPAVQRFTVDTTDPDTTLDVLDLRPAGTVSRGVWRDAYAGLEGVPFESAPDELSSLRQLEGPMSGGDFYGDRTRGYVTAPSTGAYTFWVAGDDNTELWLSTDDDPGERRRIAYDPDWSNPRDWDDAPSQRSEPVELVAGRRYYLEVRHHNWTGGDHWAVGWARPGEPTTAPSEIVPGSVLSPYDPRHGYGLAASEPASFECRVDGAAWRACSSPHVVGPLPDGAHELAVRAVDHSGRVDPTPAQHTFDVDETAPTTALTAAPEGGDAHLPGEVSHEFWWDSPGWEVADVPLGSAPDQVETATRLQGPTDVAELYGDRMRGFITAPTTGSYTFWLASDDGSELWLSGDEDPAGRRRLAFVDGWTTPLDWHHLPSQRSAPVELVAGARYYVEVLHKESSGGDHLAVGWSRPGESTVEPSEVVPGTALSAYGPHSVIATSDVTPTFAFAASESSGVECSIDGQAWVGCASALTLGPLPDGLHVLRARAFDAAGNVEERPLRRRFLIDTTPPPAPGGLDGETPTSAPVVSWTPVAGATSYRVFRDGSPVATTPGARFIDSQPGADGVRAYAVSAIDAAGNESSRSPELAVTLDTMAPETQLGTRPPSLTNDSTPTFAFSGDGSHTGFECAVDGGAFAACTSPHTAAPLGDGDHLFAVRARDAAGNVDASPATFALTLDRVPPAAPSAPSGGGTPLRLAWTGSEGPFRVRRNGVVLPPVAGRRLLDATAVDRAAPGAPRGIAVGATSPTSLEVTWGAATDAGSAYDYAVRGTDAAGNVGPWSPQATVWATAGVQRYRVLVDGTPVGETEGTLLNVGHLRAGSTHAVVVQAIDRAGNVATSEELPVTLPALTAPRVAIKASQRVARPGATVWLSADVTAGTGGPGPVRWRMGEQELGTGPVLARAFPRPGTYVVTATVAADDGTMSSAAVALTVDGASPSVPTLRAAGNRVDVRPVDDITGVVTVEVATSRRGPFRVLADSSPTLRLPEGRHELRVRATDAAGNVAVATRVVTVDTTAPRAAVTAAVRTSKPRVTARLRVADAVSGLRAVWVDGRRVKRRAVLRLAAGREHVLRVEDRSGNVTRLRFRTRSVTPWPRGLQGALDGARGDGLRFDPGGRPQRGVRARVLRATQLRLRALGRLPRTWSPSHRYTVPLLRAVQRFQRGAGLRSGSGTIGPSTRRALDAALEAERRTWRSSSAPASRRHRR